MKRKILIVIYIFLILMTLKLLYNTINNNILITKYEEGKYLVSKAKALTYFNFPQSYVSNYNYGNILYQNGEYEGAIKEYQKALSYIVPKYKKCNIRINYALALCKTVKLDESKQESIKNAIDTYESAINVLTEEGCANKNDNNGHNQNAQQLKKDIQKEINRLKKLQNNQTDGKDPDEKDDNKTNDKIEDIETKIRDIKEEATKEQRNVEEQFRYYNYDYDSNGKNW